MLKTYTYPEYAYRCSDEQRSGQRQRHPVLIVGAGPVGLTAALECARHGLAAVVIDDNNTVSVGSRAVCYAKRPLEIWDRLGVGEAFAAQGVQWQLGRVFFGDEQVYSFDLLPEAGHKMPAMINLQQYHLEERLVAACEASPLVDLRWKHKLISLAQADEHATLTIETPDGVFQTEASWVIACDGANSDTRRMVGAEFTGQFFHDRFLIADIVMKAGQVPGRPKPDSPLGGPRGGEAASLGASFPAERWFWFDPPFHRGQSVLLHKQCDDVWRIDFQLGWDADPVAEKKPENVLPRIRAMLGPEVEFELEWVSIYQFACRRIDRFRHGRVLFAGDAAHQVSPFGARGANTGIQDIDNLVWKLARVMNGHAPEALVDSYHDERAFAADDNLRQSTRSTDFITPKSAASRALRDATLQLARSEPFARRLVNSGRLSTPTPYAHSALNTPDEDRFDGGVPPGTVCADAPMQHDGEPAWLLNALGPGFTLLSFGPCPGARALRDSGTIERVIELGDRWVDAEGLAAQRYEGQPGTVVLVRPDQHVAARWRRFDPHRVRGAVLRATGSMDTLFRS